MKNRQSVINRSLILLIIGAGDFDADGHQDVVVAARGAGSLYLLSGDGRANFAPPRTVETPGRITAMIAGEINRADGLADLAIGAVGTEGARLLVYEGAEGALRRAPEIIELPAEASAFALGQLDNEYPIDLAVAAGRELLIAYGRDRRLSLDPAQQAAAPAAVIERRAFASEILSLAIGDFTGSRQSELALLLSDGSVRILARSSGDPASTSTTSLATVEPRGQRAAIQLRSNAVRISIK